MIETNFDNCYGPLHCVCRTKIPWQGQRESQSLSKEIGHYTNWNTANFVQWPLLKGVTRELIVHRGTTQLEQFIITFRSPFYRECLLNDYNYLFENI